MKHSVTRRRVLAPVPVLLASSVLTMAVSHAAITANYRSEWYAEQTDQNAPAGNYQQSVGFYDYYETPVYDDDNNLISGDPWEREDLSARLSVNEGRYTGGNFYHDDEQDGFGSRSDDWQLSNAGAPTPGSELGFEFSLVGETDRESVSFTVANMGLVPTISIARLDAGGQWGSWEGRFGNQQGGIVWDPADGDLVMTLSSASLNDFMIDYNIYDVAQVGNDDDYWDLDGTQLTIYASSVSANPHSDAGIRFSYINFAEQTRSVAGVEVNYSQEVYSQLFSNIRVVPEPGSVGLLGLASVALLRRRRA